MGQKWYLMVTLFVPIAVLFVSEKDRAAAGFRGSKRNRITAKQPDENLKRLTKMKIENLTKEVGQER